ncbi:thiosulfate sulfurtransferase (rhodanese)-like domain-containing protein 2 [Thoreauomyces humboldtii]|nr:thiosulfate sulfurtransferase (rhodanese)-like domain-containing protein 2 [Thoreauomyces humboldtii]
MTSQDTTAAQERLARRSAVHQLLCKASTAPGVWSCCNLPFAARADVYKHIQSAHAVKVQELARDIILSGDVCSSTPSPVSDFNKRRAPKGSSDSVSLSCSCPAKSGSVLLFYKYVKIEDPHVLASQQQDLCAKLELSGKLRISREGVNFTLAGNMADVHKYMQEMSNSPLLSDCDLGTSSADWEKRRRIFFKPSEGCRHVFDGLSVKVVKEVCPFDASYLPKDLVAPRSFRPSTHLSPEEFHRAAVHAQLNPDTHIILDTRNYYESSIGHFPSAHCPPIRRFSSLPAYVSANKELFEGKTVLTYCTGGVRCEKASRWIGENVPGIENVFMLDGGIHNYLEWATDAERESGPSKETVRSLFRGANYVFDARQSLASASATPISDCTACATPTFEYTKCSSPGCHKIVIACAGCSSVQSLFCCGSCRDRIGLSGSVPREWSCSCEMDRRKRLLESSVA